ncbi:hypothetical protein HDE_11226 [Halotydeus destructor]|nr:hypothetical protein HDE_11226 [Halotydeus destructor]
MESCKSRKFLFFASISLVLLIASVTMYCQFRHFNSINSDLRRELFARQNEKKRIEKIANTIYSDLLAKKKDLEKADWQVTKLQIQLNSANLEANECEAKCRREKKQAQSGEPEIDDFRNKLLDL